MSRTPVLFGGRNASAYRENLLTFIKKFTPERLEKVSDSLLQKAENGKDMASVKAAELIFKIVLSIYSMFPKDEKEGANAMERRFSRKFLEKLQQAEQEYDRKHSIESQPVEAKDATFETDVSKRV